MRGEGQIYTATLITSALSTAGPHDIVSILASSLTRVEFIGCELQQLTSAPQALQVEVWRGSTGAAAGSAITPVNAMGWPTALTARSSVSANSSSVVSTTSASRIYAGDFEIANGSAHVYPLTETIVESSQRLHIKVGTPAAAVSLAITITFAEPGLF